MQEQTKNGQIRQRDIEKFKDIAKRWSNRIPQYLFQEKDGRKILSVCLILNVPKGTVQLEAHSCIQEELKESLEDIYEAYAIADLMIELIEAKFHYTAQRAEMVYQEIIVRIC